MSKKIISAILAIAMIVSMSATMFVTSVGAAAEATDYNTDRDALKSAIINYTIQGPTLTAETIGYLKDIGLFTSKDGKWVEDEARKAVYGTTDVDDGYFFVSGAEEKLAKINDTIQYAASVWYFGSDANNELVDASFNKARNVVVKDAIGKIEQLVKDLKAEVTVDTKPAKFAAEFEAYMNWANTTAGYNQAFGVNPFYGYASNLFLNSTFSGSIIGQFAARWFTWDEVKANAQKELTAFYTELQKLVMNGAGYSGKTYYEFKTETLDKFNASWEALCKALRGDEKAVFGKLDYTDLVNSYLQLKGVVAAFDKYVSVNFNNRYTAANAELLTNVLYAKQIIEYIGTDYADKLIVMGLVDVNALIEKIVAGIAAFVPATEAALTAENIADGVALVKSAQALLDSWSNWASNDTYKATWNALNDAKNDLVAMIPNKAGEQVLYTVAASSLKVSDVEYKSAALNIYFAPNYVSYAIFAAKVEAAMKDFTAAVDAVTSKIDEIKKPVADSTLLRDALKKYGMLAGNVFAANDADGRLVRNDDASEIYLSYLLDDFGEEPCIYDKVLFIGNKGVKVDQDWADLDIDMALDNVKAFVDMYMKAYYFYAGEEGYEDAWTNDYKFDWTTDSATFKDKYAKAVADLEKTVKNLTRDITVEISTASYIVDELIQLFGLVKDTTEDIQTETTYYDYEEITANVIANVFKAISYKIGKVFASVELDELKATYNVKAQLNSADEMKTYNTKNYDGKTSKYVTRSKIDAALAEVEEIINNSQLVNMTVEVDVANYILNQITNTTIKEAVSKLLNYTSEVTGEKEYKVSNLLIAYLRDYVDDVFADETNLYTGPVSAVYNLEATYKPHFNRGDVKAVAIPATIEQEPAGNINVQFYQSATNVIICDGDQGKWAVKSPLGAWSVLVKYTGKNNLAVQFKADDFNFMEVVAVTDNTWFDPSFYYVKDEYDEDATYYWVFNAKINSRRTDSEEEEELYSAEPVVEEPEYEVPSQFQYITVGAYEGYVFNYSSVGNRRNRTWYIGEYEVEELEEAAITEEAFDTYFGLNEVVDAIVGSETVTKIGSVIHSVIFNDSNIIDFHWYKLDEDGKVIYVYDDNDIDNDGDTYDKVLAEVEFYAPVVRTHEDANDTRTKISVTDVTKAYFENVKEVWLKLYDAVFSEANITKEVDVPKVGRHGRNYTVKETQAISGAEYIELVAKYLEKANSILSNYNIANGVLNDPAEAELLKIFGTQALYTTIVNAYAAFTGTTNEDKIAELKNFAAAVREKIAALDESKIYDADHRLFTNMAAVRDQATQMYAEDKNAAYTWQKSASYPAKYFEGFVNAVNAFEKIVNSASVNQKGESTHTNVNLTDLDKAYDAVIAAANKLLTEKGEGVLQKFEDKVIEVYKANVNGEGTKGLGEFNDYDTLYQKYMAYFGEEYDDEMWIADGTGILYSFNLAKTRSEVYVYFALTLQTVLNEDAVGNLYSYANDCYKVNLLNKLEKLCGDLDVAKYARAWAEEYNEFRKVASCVRDIIKDMTVTNGVVKLNSDMPLEYVLNVLNAVEAKYNEKEDNTLEAIAAYKADLNALIAKAAEVEVYQFVTDTDDAKAIWTAFTEAYAAAQKVALDARCSKADIDAAAEALNTALEALLAIEAPEGAATLETLNAKIEAAYTLIARADVTTDASKKALEELLIATKKDIQFSGILNSSDIAAKISAIDNAMKALKLAMFNAQNLKKEVKVLEMQVVIALYTEGSYKVFKDACDEAYAVAEADTAKESEMKAYLAKVEAKFNALVLAPVEEEPVKSEVLEQAIAIYNDAAAEYATLSGYTAESVAALKAALDTLKADIANEADDAKLLESIIAVKLARAALTVVVPETLDD